jgi:hypothetical protein
MGMFKFPRAAPASALATGGNRWHPLGGDGNLAADMSVLSELLAEVKTRLEHRPVMVFDLDSTLFSTQERNHVILHEFATEIGAPDDFRAVLERIQPADMGWNVMDDLRRRGFRHEPTLGRLRSFWQSRFFRDEYLRHDLPLPGAATFVREAHDAGSTIYYLTGRDEPGMGRGTRASLAAHGFPVEGEKVHLRLKPRFEDDDLDFKRQAVDEIRSLGEVLALFENEPANANLFIEAFPDARVFFLETVHSPNPPPLLPGIFRLRDFSR